LHFVDAARPRRRGQARLNGLLTYGEPFNGSDEGDAFVVIPRFGTISPWASKATDIVHNCGMGHIHRVERVIFRVRSRAVCWAAPRSSAKPACRPWPRCCTTA
jgi:phosphoribosylformylglycinamidine synthase